MTKTFSNIHAETNVTLHTECKTNKFVMKGPNGTSHIICTSCSESSHCFIYSSQQLPRKNSEMKFRHTMPKEVPHLNFTGRG